MVEVLLALLGQVLVVAWDLHRRIHLQIMVVETHSEQDSCIAEEPGLLYSEPTVHQNLGIVDIEIGRMSVDLSLQVVLICY